MGNIDTYVLLIVHAKKLTTFAYVVCAGQNRRTTVSAGGMKIATLVYVLTQAIANRDEQLVKYVITIRIVHPSTVQICTFVRTEQLVILVSLMPIVCLEDVLEVSAKLLLKMVQHAILIQIALHITARGPIDVQTEPMERCVSVMMIVLPDVVTWVRATTSLLMVHFAIVTQIVNQNTARTCTSAPTENLAKPASRIVIVFQSDALVASADIELHKEKFVMNTQTASQTTVLLFGSALIKKEEGLA